MDDLALIFSHHNRETSRKRLHEDENAAALACIFSFNTTTTSNSSQYYPSTKADANQQQQIQFNSTQWSLERVMCTAEANPSTINLSPGLVYQNGGTARRTGEQAQQHLLAERKRRQKMTKLFVSLASLLPGLTKMDKASILEGATSFIRQIREKTGTKKDHLETKTINEKGTVPAVKKARNYDMSILPEVVVRSLEKEVLITVYCNKQRKGIIDEILSVIQKLHLTIKSRNFMPFGSTTMHITIIAQINDELCETTYCLAEKLRQSIFKMLR